MKLRVIWTMKRITASLIRALRWVIDGYALGYHYMISSMPPSSDPLGSAPPCDAVVTPEEWKE
jgi:hypothetical protein